jgi:hypothetical protein
VSELRLLSPTSRSSPQDTVGLGCQACPFLPDCGGVFSDYDCLGNCCGDPEHCEVACPRSHHFGEVVEDSGGWNRRTPTLKQDRSCSLPLYIPCIQNGSQRAEPLSVPIAAVPTFSVTRGAGRQRFASGVDLRKQFGLSRETRLVLLSVKDDPDLETYWKYSELRSLPQYIANLGIEHITAPNFSFANNVPRTEHLVNLARSLRCIEEFSAAGLSVIPHLNACNDRQWDFWCGFLKEHLEITMVAKEFQTGAAIPRIAQWHIEQLQGLQEKIGRGLHLLAVAGRRHLRLLVRLERFTIIDSVPFLRTVKRRRMSRHDGRWRVCRTKRGEPLHGLLRHNVEVYSTGIEETVMKRRQYLLPFDIELLTPTSNEMGASTNRIDVESFGQLRLLGLGASA